MQSHRIIIANKQRLWREMLRRVIEKLPDLKVVGEISDWEELPEALEQSKAEWVIVSLDANGTMPDCIKSLLAGHPTVRVLALDANGSEVKMRWVEAHEKDLNDLSLGALITALRSQSPWESSVQNIC